MTAEDVGGEAVIVGARLGPGHDGRAEVVVELAYPNGGRSQLSVPQEVATRALDAAGVSVLDDLRGRPWTVLVPAPLPSATVPRKDLPCSIS